MTDLSRLPAATDDNQLGAHLCRLWDEQRAVGMISGKWSPEVGRFVTLEEWIKTKGNSVNSVTISKIFATVDVYDLLHIIRLANVAADNATDADTQAYARLWHDVKEVTGWCDEELAEKVVGSAEVQP